MLMEQININTDCLRQLEEDIVIRGKLLHSFVDCCSSISKLYIHSDTLIKSILNIFRDYYETKRDDQINESSISSNILDEISRDSVTKNGNYYRKKDNDEDFIRFTNSGSLFQISKSIIQSIPYSYIYEASSEESRDIDELINRNERRDTKKKKIEKEEEIELIINGNKDKIIKDYLVKNGLWKNYIMNYNNGFADYNHIDDNLYIDKIYEYIEYINEYIKNKIIDIEEDKISTIKQDLFEKEMIDLFSDQGKEEAREAIMGRWFKESTIINRELEKPLVNWLVYKLHSKEFLFALSNEHNIPPTKYDYVGSEEKYGIESVLWGGPIFGRVGDIGISDECHNDKESFCDAEYYDVVNTPQKSSLFVNTDDANRSNYFIVEDYEVWGRT
ncbi:hypothetical protein WA158_006657 [Blastocystis sp. Blastoise]